MWKVSKRVLRIAFANTLDVAHSNLSTLPPLELHQMLVLEYTCLPRNHPMCQLRYALALLCCCSLIEAQDKPSSIPFGDAVIESHLTLEAARLGERGHEGTESKADWEAKRPQLKREFFDMLGLWRLPERTPLNAKVTGKLD